MIRKPLQKGFGVYFDPSKSTSGQRFFSDLRQALGAEALPLEERPATILFNVSAPLKAIVKAKWRGHKIVLRIDGLYFDRLSPAFLASFNWPLRKVFSIGQKHSRFHDWFAFWANLINQNYGAFVRILLADLIIYQSKFSQKVHSRYFAKKPYRIIVNGSIYRGESESIRVSAKDGAIHLVTVYDDWKPAKRLHDLVDFVRWAREKRNISLRLTILGYTGKVPACAPPHMKAAIENDPGIRILPRFDSFSQDVQKILFDSDMFISFTYRDPCPNVVVESMAHGLPVVGVASGGMRDIVGDAGLLMPCDDFERGFFSCHRYERDFPVLDFDEILDAIFHVSKNKTMYQIRVRNRFREDLDIKVVAARYAAAMR